LVCEPLGSFFSTPPKKEGREGKRKKETCYDFTQIKYCRKGKFRDRK
jgi:hypothetical protein